MISCTCILIYNVHVHITLIKPCYAMTVYITRKYILYTFVYFNVNSVQYNNVLIWTSWKTSTLVFKEISRIQIY